MQEDTLDPDNCPFRNVLATIMDPWSTLILNALSGGKLRFMDILRAVQPISKRMLSKTLRSLEADGLVTRTVYPTKPPSVEYALTEMGESFLPHIYGLSQWAVTNQSAIEASRREFAA